MLSGLSVGVVTATATAYLAELHLGARPGASPARAQLLATTANLGGLGLGPLIAGLLAQCVGAPLTVPFVLFLVLLGAAAVGVALGAPRPCPGHRRGRPTTRSASPSPPRPAGASSGPPRAAVVAFAAFGLFTSLAPTFLAVTLGHTSHALAGVPAFTAFTAAVVAQHASRAWDMRRVLTAGTAALSAGVLLVVAATWLGSLAAFLAGGVVAGAGAGLLFKGGVVTVSGLAAPARRAEALAGFFLAGYVGISVPVLGLGVLGEWVAPRVAPARVRRRAARGAGGLGAIAARRRPARARASPRADSGGRVLKRNDQFCYRVLAVRLTETGATDAKDTAQDDPPRNDRPRDHPHRLRRLGDRRRRLGVRLGAAGGR